MPNPLSDRDLYSMYDEYINSVYGETVQVGEHRYDTATAMKQVDETSYNVGFNDWIDSECENETLYEQDGQFYDQDPNELNFGDAG